MVFDSIVSVIVLAVIVAAVLVGVVVLVAGFLFAQASGTYFFATIIHNIVLYIHDATMPH